MNAKNAVGRGVFRVYQAPQVDTCHSYVLGVVTASGVIPDVQLDRIRSARPMRAGY